MEDRRMREQTTLDLCWNTTNGLDCIRYFHHNWNFEVKVKPENTPRLKIYLQSNISYGIISRHKIEEMITSNSRSLWIGNRDSPCDNSIGEYDCHMQVSIEWLKRNTFFSLIIPVFKFSTPIFKKGLSPWNCRP